MRVTELIAAYRHRGHKRATIDPLGMMERPPTPVLDLAYHHLSAADLDTMFQTGSFFYGAEKATLRDIVAALEHTYCGSVGAEYMHIVDAAEQLLGPAAPRERALSPEYGADVKTDDRRAPDRGGRSGAIPAEQISRHQALRSRRRREPDPDARRADPARRFATAPRRS